MGSMAIKLDMSKAYDRVEWDFLEAVLLRLGFSENWTSLLMGCVRSVSYSVLVNGIPGETFTPTRGLRQGDPLSPYLFIMCAEGLTSLLQIAERDGSIQGVSASKRGLKINHLLFADDCVIFSRAKMEEWTRIMYLLAIYERASGQVLNKQKTSLFFSSNTKEETKAFILQGAAGISCDDYNKYLGLPTLVGRTKYNTFHGLKEKIWKRMNSWKNSFLSTAGKEILIKSVLQAIPTYTMSIFKLPIRLVREIEMMFSNFWWNHKKEGRGVHWRKWEKMGKSKQDEGLVLDLVRKGSVWRVGNGNSIRIWKDKWLPKEKTFEVQTCPNTIPAESKVSCLIDSALMKWNTEMVKTIFKPEEAQLICSLPVSLRGAADSSIWGYKKKGIFTVRSAYFVDLDTKHQKYGEPSGCNQFVHWWNAIWHLEVIGKVKHFLWKSVSNLLPTKENLFKKKILDSPLCPVCDRGIETTLHGLWECPVARDVWGDRESPVAKWGSSFDFFASSWTEFYDRLEAKNLFGDENGHYSPRLYGEPHFMLAAQKHSVSSAFMAEAYALWRAFTLCDEMGVRSVVFKGDARLVVDAVKNSSPDFAWHGQLVEDLKNELAIHPSWNLSFTSRGNNKVAHELARLAYSVVTETVWIEEGPDVVSSLISDDKLCSSD
ncbi:uncharacterized protein LOC122289281 [Carya illinoinensis]|uniref:uncharacterized protein LOC122289281 n=1 Tax=Carya illinoinensis TaxID=32201 RepID=UPI001C717FA6|nr:uncharacterized protein LOC122289281 [Carya illinoinensis]